MAWKAMDVQEQRVRFVVAASRREKPLTQLCAEFGISRPTGSLWIKRYAEAGLAGYRSAAGVPIAHPRRPPGSRKRG
jgi:transposase